MPLSGAAAAALLALLLVACGLVEADGGPDAAEPPGASGPRAGVPADVQPAAISGHVDGDTLRVAVDAAGPIPPGEDHRVRLLQVDAPEVAGSPAGAECYGPEAAAFTARELPLGTRVWLEADTELRDRFGRELRYLWTDDGRLFNERLVAEGYAVAVLYEPNDARIGRMRAAEARARAAERGLWGACATG